MDPDIDPEIKKVLGLDLPSRRWKLCQCAKGPLPNADQLQEDKLKVINLRMGSAGIDNFSCMHCGDTGLLRKGQHQSDRVRYVQ